MSIAEYLPSVPQPPHDPRTWVLNKQAGWRIAKYEKVVEDQNGSLSLLKQKSKEFVNDLVIPANVVFDGQDIWLLDKNATLLKRFDGCQCRFEVVPCIGGKGEGLRKLSTPGGIAIHSGNLYLCDTGNHRIQVIDLYGWTLRSVWLSPSGLVQNWQPVEVVIDSQQRFWILDHANKALLLFSCYGSYLAKVDAPGVVSRLVTDVKGEPYFWLDNGEQYHLSVNKDMLPIATMQEDAGPLLKKLPFPVRSGNINLSAYCTSSDPDIWFDSHGERKNKKEIPGLPVISYPASGLVITNALDSQRNQCLWDRIELQCQLAEGTRLHIKTYTSELHQDEGEIFALDDSRWQSFITFNSRSQKTRKHRDGLVRSQPGRFLWLKIYFEGDRTNTPILEQLNLDYPRISLRRYLPGVFGVEPLSTDFTDRFLAIFDRGFRQIEQQIDQQASLFDPMSAPTGTKNRDFLTWLASWVGVQFFHGWSSLQKRQFLKQASQLFTLRGTRKGLMQQLLWYVGIADLNSTPRKAECAPCTEPAAPKWNVPEMVLEHFYLRRWMFLGAGRLSEQATLWGEKLLGKSRLDSRAINGVTRLNNVKDASRDPFHFHAHQFSVFVPASCASTIAKKNAIKDLVEREKPAHTQANIVFVKPRFRIGIQSMIGFDSVIGRLPAGVSLQDMHLGRATVLTSDTNPQSTTRIGSESRIGQTTLMK
ncbi:MAG: phage tail protein [Arenicellales bacterium]